MFRQETPLLMGRSYSQDLSDSRPDDAALRFGPDRRRGCGSRDQNAVDFPGNVSLQAAHDLALGLALGGAPGDVLFGAPLSHADTTQIKCSARLASRSPTLG